MSQVGDVAVPHATHQVWKYDLLEKADMFDSKGWWWIQEWIFLLSKSIWFRKWQISFIANDHICSSWVLDQSDILQNIFFIYFSVFWTERHQCSSRLHKHRVTERWMNSWHESDVMYHYPATTIVNLWFYHWPMCFIDSLYFSQSINCHSVFPTWCSPV